MVPESDFDESSETTVVFDRRDLMDGLQPAETGRAHVLVRMDGSEVGQVTTLKGTTLEIGRLAACAIHLPFEGVSRKHARLVWQGGAFVLEDLGSANGTFVQGTKITRQELADGNVIQLGPRVVFRYSITDSSEEKILRQLYESSVKDSLTGAFNREYFGERLKAEVAYALRHQTELSLLLMDVDHFKKVNDTYGHPAGDAVLAGVVGALGQTLRTEDVVARYGGEEFAVVLRGIALAQAATVGERLRTIVERTNVLHDDRTIRVTMSVGTASIACCEAPGMDALVAIADRRLYIAKRAGRNRVVSEG
ncbi:MAG TPA: GGDEF domain-containing protein [Polyangiaceae bacterium]|nr:GGDEF domain-containing protein [Polyangiaceae bacterium]